MIASARRIRIDLAYDGTGFAGWQVQPRLRTVQGVLGETLERIQGTGRVPVRAAGRTDAGVHARAQVVDAEIVSRLDDTALLRALWSMLPSDLRPLSLRTVHSTFHAQHDAVSKTYRYWLDLSGPGDPFRSRYALHYPHPIDRGLLREALGRLPGRRDWGGFAGSACGQDDRVRTLVEADWGEPAEDVGVFSFTADGFLTHMVRNLVGTLLEISRGRFEPSRVDEVLATGDRTLAGPTAPPHGLFLERVEYAPQGGIEI